MDSQTLATRITVDYVAAQQVVHPTSIENIIAKHVEIDNIHKLLVQKLLALLRENYGLYPYYSTENPDHPTNVFFPARLPQEAKNFQLLIEEDFTMEQETLDILTNFVYALRQLEQRPLIWQRLHPIYGTYYVLPLEE